VTRFELQSSKRDIVLGYDVGNPPYFMHFNKKGDALLMVLLEFTLDDKVYENLYYIDLKSLKRSKIASYEYRIPKEYEGEYRLIKDALFSTNQEKVIVFFKEGKCVEIALKSAMYKKMHKVSTKGAKCIVILVNYLV